MNKAIQSDRLVFPKSIKYNPKVKTGNWYEDQLVYRRDYFQHNSEYYHEFQKKPFTTIEKPVKWDILLKAEGTCNVCPPKLDDCSPNFYNNFSTTYQLAYEHFPKIAPPINEKVLPSVRRIGKWRPVLEFIDNYGNLYNYGLGDPIKKNNQFEDITANRRTTSESVAEMDYTKPPEDKYVFCRWPRYRAIKKKTADIYPPLQPNHPRLSNYNPLTWEVRDTNKPQPNFELDC